MILALIICAWSLILVAVASLCAVARAGDGQQQSGAASEPAWEFSQSALAVRRSVADAIVAAPESDGTLIRSAA